MLDMFHDQFVLSVMSVVKGGIKEHTLSRSSPRLNSDSYRKQEKGRNGLKESNKAFRTIKDIIRYKEINIENLKK